MQQVFGSESVQAVNYIHPCSFNIFFLTRVSIKVYMAGKRQKFELNNNHSYTKRHIEIESSSFSSSTDKNISTDLYLGLLKNPLRNRKLLFKPR